MKKLLATLFVLITFWGKSQDFEYQVLFEGIGDNREFFNDYGFPQTILGARGAFEVGIKSDNHRMRAGLSQLLEFGSDFDTQKPKLTLYYQFNDTQKEFLFGAFPRREKINFPLAMLTDTLLYYRPNIEGMFGELRWDWGHQNAFVDWIQHQTEVDREIFTAGLSGELFFGNLFIEDYFSMSHVAHPSVRIEGEHIEDYSGFSLRAGIRTNKESVIKGYLKAGILNSSYQERGVTKGYLTANSFFAEGWGKWKSLGLKTVLHSGGSHRFAYGDLFYRAENYLRTDVIWYFINHEKVKGTFNFSFHVINWEELNNQQQLSIIYVFGK
jgi:hypothetical protein